jgi:hypothetical protein
LLLVRNVGIEPTSSRLKGERIHICQSRKIWWVTLELNHLVF